MCFSSKQNATIKMRACLVEKIPEIVYEASKSTVKVVVCSYINLY